MITNIAFTVPGEPQGKGRAAARAVHGAYRRALHHGQRYVARV